MTSYPEFEFNYRLNLFPHLKKLSSIWSNDLINKGYIKGLANGPYGDPETPVRNTAHALTALSKSYSYFDDNKYELSAKSALNYLFSQEARPCGAAFICRSNPQKDFCNGLVGQAFIIESFVAAFKSFNIQQCLDTACQLYQQHCWDEEFCLWRRLSVDGSYLSFDFTLNHQLWFAAEASFLPKSVSSRQVNKFLDNLESKITLYSDGCIFHNSYINYSVADSLLKYNAKRALSIRNYLSTARSLRSKSIGYHCFNLYAFARLFSIYPDHAFWKTSTWKAIKSFDVFKSLMKDKNSQVYGLHYNPSAIEYAYFYHSFFSRNANPYTANFIMHHLQNTVLDDLSDTSDYIKSTTQIRFYEAFSLLEFSL